MGSEATSLLWGPERGWHGASRGEVSISWEEEQDSEEEFNCKSPVVKDEGSSLNVVSSFPGMLVVIVLLLIAIAVVAVWPTH